MRTIVFGSALLLTVPSLVKAEEARAPIGAAPDTGATAGSPTADLQTAPDVPNPPTAEPAPPASSAAGLAAPLAQAEVSEPAPRSQAQPEPSTGWGRGKRAPMYVSLMLSVGALTEDGGNRLTTRDSKVMEGFGGVLRLGGVLGEHHRVGARLQSLVRPTKKVLLDPPANTSSNPDWGSVSFGYLGPEYLYNTDFGLFAGGSLGIAGLLSSSDRSGDRGDDNHVERGSAGVAAIVSLGYEWRTNKWFAMSIEAFGGYYHGIDDNDGSMNSGLFGLAMGMGF